MKEEQGSGSGIEKICCFCYIPCLQSCIYYLSQPGSLKKSSLLFFFFLNSSTACKYAFCLHHSMETVLRSQSPPPSQNQWALLHRYLTRPQLHLQLLIALPFHQISPPSAPGHCSHLVFLSFSVFLPLTST